MLTLCYASAGAGKTRSLVHTYLRRSLSKGGDFRRIAAITFTNKAAYEMKKRLLHALHSLATGSQEGLYLTLLEDLDGSPEELQQRSQGLYNRILQDYEAFTVTTIDGFFQGIVDGFRQELGLPADHEVTLAVKVLLESALEAFWRSLPEDKTLEEALIAFGQQRLWRQQYWDITKVMLQLGYDVVSSQSPNSMGKERAKADFFATAAKKVADFDAKLMDMAKTLHTTISQRGHKADDFAWGTRGLWGFLQKLATKQQVSITPRIRKGTTNVDAWITKSRQTPDFIDFIENQCQPMLTELVDYHDAHATHYNTLRALQPLYYTLLTANKLQTCFIAEGKRMKKIPINALPHLLQSIIERNPIEFIYTHLSRHYDYFLLDEFQDVSRRQWGLLYPLIAHGLANGGGAFLVGDVKQAIYRWRGGDVSLFLHQVEQDIGPSQVTQRILPANWRSKRHIVHYNNLFFPLAAKKITQHLSEASPLGWMQQAANEGLALPTAAYAHTEQKVARDDLDGGYVEVVLHHDVEKKQDWRAAALQHMEKRVKALAEEGFAPGDMAILVRDKKEGHAVVDALFSAKKAGGGPHYEATFLGGFPMHQHPHIILLLHALRYLSTPKPDNLLLANLVHHHQLHNTQGKGRGQHWQKVVPMSEQVARELLPKSFIDEAETLAKKPLYALVSLLMEQFNLVDTASKPFLNAFQEAAHTFTPKGGSLHDFLRWWDKEGQEQTLHLGQNSTRISVMTMHQAKGLAFKVVLLPFVDWSLNHPPHAAPILWATTEEPPFHQLGPLPIYYGKHLEATHYRDTYYKERMGAYLESLNLFYVATTRPRERLYIFAPQKTGLSTMGGLLSQTLIELTNEGKLPWERKITGTLTCWQLGSPKPPAQRSPLRKSSTIPSYHNSLARHDAMLEEVQSIHASKGTWWHRLLAHIETTQDIAPLLLQYVVTQQLTASEAKKIEHTLMKWCTRDPMRSWFSGSWQVKRECGILLPHGALLQPDRVMIKGEEVVVLDYKTGRPKPEHEQQVRTYAETLRNMGHTEVKAYLFYTTNYLLRFVR